LCFNRSVRFFNNGRCRPDRAHNEKWAIQNLQTDSKVQLLIRFFVPERQLESIRNRAVKLFAGTNPFGKSKCRKKLVRHGPFSSE
jgi:hypothetical protein